ncbi:MAG TPA: hypothetical protein VE978_10335 [Chitinophagales bacterium]|nr:hypothetical protein [Chitinophagales bacterium]
MIIVSDTTVLSNFLIIKRLDLLKFVYQELIIPTAVANELSVLKSFNIDTSPIFDSSFIRIQSPTNANKVTEFKKVVDAGEAEAITSRS